LQVLEWLQEENLRSYAPIFVHHRLDSLGYVRETLREADHASMSAQPSTTKPCVSSAEFSNVRHWQVARLNAAKLEQLFNEHAEVDRPPPIAPLFGTPPRLVKVSFPRIPLTNMGVCRSSTPGAGRRARWGASSPSSRRYSRIRVRVLATPLRHCLP